MRIGFTATRNGLSPAQFSTLGVLLVFKYKPTLFMHGSCKGGDVKAARLVRKVCRGNVWIVALPGPPGNLWYEQSGVDDETREAKGFHPRNRDIAEQCELLIACPAEMTDQRSGGTWYTIAWARGQNRSRVIVWPDGKVTEELATAPPDDPWFAEEMRNSPPDPEGN